MFCVEMGGPESKIFMFGLKIQTTIAYPYLKAKQPFVLDYNFDYTRKRLNISVHSKNFATLLSLLENSISKHGFDYNPQLKQVNIKNVPQDASSLSTNNSRYSAALSGIISTAEKQQIEDHAPGSRPMNPWKRRTIPSVINFTEPDQQAFPPFPPRANNPPNQGDNNSDNQETVATNATTISISVIHEAC
jgi:hypothetical protein